jgi:predicted ATP-binding protein involved in virulence
MDAGGYYEDMFKWFYRRENAELRERLDRRDDGRDMEYSDLRSVRRAITKSVENVERLFFRDEKVMIGLKEEIAGLQELQLDQLSDGYRNLIGLIMDFARRLAQAHPQFDDPLQAPGIMLIDEIELHLHPRWQQTVIPKLCNAFPNTQIIVTTHSPEVVTTVEAGSIQILEHAALRPCPAPTFGARSSDVVSEVMGLESLRPPNNPNTERISRLFDAIDDGNLAAAQAIREELREWAGDYPEPDLVRADLLMRRLESRKQRGSSEK